MPANIPNQQTQAELNNLGAPVTTRTISFLELVQRSWGEEFRAPDRGIYEMTAGRKFDSTDTGSTGIYAGGNGPFMPTPPNPTPAPPSGPADPYWANVSMLLRGVPPSGSSWIRDYSQYATGITNYGNPVVSDMAYLFNTDSMHFDGASYCAKAGDAHTNFGTGDFCIEGWVNPGTSTGVQTVMARANATGTAMALRINAGAPELYLRDSSGTETAISAGAAGTLTALSPATVAFTYADGRSCQVSANQQNFYDAGNVYSIGTDGQLTLIQSGTEVMNNGVYRAVVTSDGTRVYQGGGYWSVFSVNGNGTDRKSTRLNSSHCG